MIFVKRYLDKLGGVMPLSLRKFFRNMRRLGSLLEHEQALVLRCLHADPAFEKLNLLEEVGAPEFETAIDDLVCCGYARLEQTAIGILVVTREDRGAGREVVGR